jgi:hypothetical protein
MAKRRKVHWHRSLPKRNRLWEDQTVGLPVLQWHCRVDPLARVGPHLGCGHWSAAHLLGLHRITVSVPGHCALVVVFTSAMVCFQSQKSAFGTRRVAVAAAGQAASANKHSSTFASYFIISRSQAYLSKTMLVSKQV